MIEKCGGQRVNAQSFTYVNYVSVTLKWHSRIQCSHSTDKPTCL